MIDYPLPPGLAEALRKTSPRPLRWEDVIGNTRAVEILREDLAASKKDGKPAPHTILYGPPGTGKTSLAKLVAADRGGICVETTGSTLETMPDLVVVLDRLCMGREQTGAPSTLFLDEIHRLGAGGSGRQAVDVESFYTVLEDFVLYHNLVGKEIVLASGVSIRLSQSSLAVWPFQCLGATTEPGVLASPLLRRFLRKIELEPYTPDEIARIIMQSAARLGYAMDEAAAAEFSKFSRANPGEALSLVSAGHSRAQATDQPLITLEIAQEVVGRLNLYPGGLTPTDVAVLRALEQRGIRGMGVAELSNAVRISQSQFTGLVEPYLRMLGYLETRARRVLTTPGLLYLTDIGQVDASRPEIRAALAKREKANAA